MTFEIRQTLPSDLDSLVRLLAQSGEAYGWCKEKWHHYYRDFPGGQAVSLSAVNTCNGEIIGHFGMLPVTVPPYSSFQTHHVIVDRNNRDIRVILKLFSASEAIAKERKAAFICGVPNQHLIKVANRLCGWKVLGYFHFSDVSTFDPSAYSKRYHFEYQGDWAPWKFGEGTYPFVHDYTKNDKTYKQLLKCDPNSKLTASNLGEQSINVWHPDNNSETDDQGWCQPFYFQQLCDDLPEDIFLIANWFVEMGDSDTFEVNKPWLKKDV